MTALALGDELEQRCRFSTARLAVRGWKDEISTRSGREALAQIVAAILTDNVAKTLPVGWQGVETKDDALNWIGKRSEEGSVMTVRLARTCELIGLLLIGFDTAAANQRGLRLRLGYFLSESNWGRGLGSELIHGLVCWCSNAGDVREVIGVVEPGNLASAKVLTRNGFEPSVSTKQEGMLTLRRRF